MGGLAYESLEVTGNGFGGDGRHMERRAMYGIEINRTIGT
jgi:hypothetical protein